MGHMIKILNIDISSTTSNIVYVEIGLESDRLTNYSKYNKNRYFGLQVGLQWLAQKQLQKVVDDWVVHMLQLPVSKCENKKRCPTAVAAVSAVATFEKVGHLTHLWVVVSHVNWMKSHVHNVSRKGLVMIVQTMSEVYLSGQ